MNDTVTLKALAKINLGLDVLGRRENGYHDVRMVMQTIYLYDNVTVEKTEEMGIHLECNLFYLPVDETNIAYKAAKLLMDEFDIKEGVRIVLDKHIPVAAGLAEQTALDPAWLTAIVVGGAFFGDNLSFISDTTIAATRTQECELRDKFRVNVRIVAPAALIMLCIYLFTATDIAAPTPERIEGIKIIPYLLVLITAIAGLNVMKVLILGIVAAGVIGIATNSFGALEWCSCMGQGINGMGELIIITMLAGGLLELIRVNGGIDYLINLLTRHISGRRGAEGSIAALVCMANLCTANNTIAILSVGTIARDIADRYGIDRRRSASLLDTFSCLTQGVLPYGAQLLMAAGLTGLSPLNIIGYLYYPMIMGACAVLAIIFRYPRKF
jgi:Na+/H+ antiporter NhaC